MVHRPKLWRVAAVCLAVSACGGGDETPDPEVGRQWYLYGVTSDPAVVSIHLPRYTQYRGQGVLVAIVDNGVDIEHEDLTSNISWGNHSYLPTDYGFRNADHGTAVAGIIAAAADNGLGGRGVAPGAKLVTYNALRAPATENIADALVRGMDRVSVSNNSWGDFNAWGEPLHLKPQIESALARGTSEGRGGQGVVYVFSAGNGAVIDSNGTPSDNVNYSGLVNNQYTLPVCAVDEHGQKATYSETGATLLVCAPSRGAEKSYGIFTTDVTGDLGYNTSKTTDNISNRSYTALFGGTSAAAPMVSGVVALMLEANPRLTWRDVRYILASTAQKNDPDDPGWSRNGAGLHINHSFGFGLVNAEAALMASEGWINLPPSLSIGRTSTVAHIIPDDDAQGIENGIVIDDSMIVEFVDVVFDAPNHSRVGDLTVTLTSPSGTQSVLSERHNQVFGTFRYANWRFGTLRHLGETAKGTWTLSVQDRRSGEVGRWETWRLALHGYRPRPPVLSE